MSSLTNVIDWVSSLVQLSLLVWLAVRVGRLERARQASDQLDLLVATAEAERHDTRGRRWRPVVISGGRRGLSTASSTTAVRTDEPNPQPGILGVALALLAAFVVAGVLDRPDHTVAPAATISRPDCNPPTCPPTEIHTAKDPRVRETSFIA